MFQVLVDIFKQLFHLFPAFTLNGQAGAECIIALQQVRCLESCLQMEMIGSRGTASGPVVENNVVRQLPGQGEHVSRFMADALRHMGMNGDGDVITEDGKRIGEDDVLFEERNATLYCRAIELTEEAGALRYCSVVDPGCGRSHPRRIILHPHGELLSP